MTPNPFLDLVFHWIGGLASASFYIPYRGVKNGARETFWLVGGFFSWIIAPWGPGPLLGLLLRRARGLRRTYVRPHHALPGDFAGIIIIGYGNYLGTLPALATNH